MLELTLEVRGLESVTHIIQAVSGPKLWAVVRQAFEQYSGERLQEFRRNPGPVHIPFVWTTPKQRYWAIRTRNWGKGMPYPRSGAIFAGWQSGIVAAADSMTLILSNNAPGIQFVQGIKQQPGHIATGWISAPNRVQETFGDLATRIGSGIGKN